MTARGGAGAGELPNAGEEDRPAVSVVSPFYNEEAVLGDAVPRMIAELDRDFAEGWELVLVDDGSTDGSLSRLEAVLAGADRPAAVRVLSYGRNQGRGRALKTGIDAARGEVVVTTEIDGSWGESIARRLVDALEARPELDFVVASPHLPGGGLVNVPAVRRFLTRFGNQLIRLFFASNVTMNTGMTRAYRRDVIQPLVVHNDDKEFHLEVLLKLLTIGFRVGEIPATITWPGRKRIGSGKTAGRVSRTRIPSTIAGHLRFIAIAQPVRYFAYLSLVSLVIGIAFEGAAAWMLTRETPSVFLAIIGLIMCLFCLLLAGFSVLFFQLRESLREHWMVHYPRPWPPSKPRTAVVYPPERSGSRPT